MKNIVVEVPCIHDPIKAAPGFVKKELADAKLDILALCGFGCAYCSSNTGNYLRIRGQAFTDFARQQVGEPLTPVDEPALTYVWPDVIGKLEEQLRCLKPGFGRGRTLVFSMLTDGFSPLQLKDGTTERVLRLVLDHTEFRIRVLTKNAVVGNSKWIRFFRKHPDRFVVGLSIGTLDDAWARRVEVGTSTPTARVRALHALQDSGVPTFGMLCPVFPEVLEEDRLEQLLDAIRPEETEAIWAEPYNDRKNWRAMQSTYEAGSKWHTWYEQTFGDKGSALWSTYATELYVRILEHAKKHGWTDKLRYLLYEDRIREDDAAEFTELRGVLLQSKTDEDGFSKNPFIKALQ